VVDVSSLGLVTPGGKVVWGKYAKITNYPENEACVIALLLGRVRISLGICSRMI
jgi:ribosome biogenesis protein NSA2